MVISTRLPFQTHKPNRGHKGFAFIHCPASAADSMIAKLHGKKLSEHVLNVERSTGKKK